MPHAGVGAVVLRDGCLLMVRRAREPARGKWSIPGGAVELGESLHEAVRREAAEECSVEIEVERLFDVTETILHDDDGKTSYHFVLVDFLAVYKSGEPRARSDADECRWVPLDELVGLDMPETLRDVLKRRGIIQETGGSE